MTNFSESLRELKNEWRAGDMKSVIALASKFPDDFIDVQKLRLKAALTEKDWSVVADAANHLVAAAPELTLTAVKRLLQEDRGHDAAQLLLKLNGRADPEYSALAERAGLALFKEGILANLKGQTRAALELWSLGTRIAPNNISLKRKMSEAQAAAIAHAKSVSMDRDPGAYVAAWEAVLETDPDNLVAAKRLAAAATKQGNAKQAFASWTRVLDLEPGNEGLAIRITKAAIQSGDEASALVRLDGGKHNNEEKNKCLKLLRRRVIRATKQHLVEGDLGSGVENFIALAKSPGDVKGIDRLRSSLALRLTQKLRLARKSGNEIEAAHLADLLLEIDDRNVLALSTSARHALRCRNFKNAAGLYEKLLHERPDFPHAAQFLARARANMNQSRPVKVTKAA